jgi:transcriptional regulator of met regulon
MYICVLKQIVMAIPIKAVPILTGEAAEEFVRRAEEREQERKRNPRQPLSKEEEDEINEVMRRMREFIPSWKKKQTN